MLFLLYMIIMIFGALNIAHLCHGTDEGVKIFESYMRSLGTAASAIPNFFMKLTRGSRFKAYAVYGVAVIAMSVLWGYYTLGEEKNLVAFASGPSLIILILAVLIVKPFEEESWFEMETSISKQNAAYWWLLILLSDSVYLLGAVYSGDIAVLGSNLFQILVVLSTPLFIAFEKPAKQESVAFSTSPL